MDFVIKNVAEFDSYKAFIKYIEVARADLQRGFRSRLAEAAECQNAFVSQVLNTGAHFSLEQGLRVTKFFNFGPEEAQYFMLLLEENRAGTKELKMFFKQQLDAYRERLLNISARVEVANTLTAEAKATFYSRWYYSAIHVLPSIKKYQSIDAIVEALELPKALVQDAVLFLVTHGLLEEKKGVVTIGPSQIHLSKESPHIFNHHTNWRLRMLETLNTGNGDVHYSAVSTLSAEDAEKLKFRMVDFIQDYVKTIGASVPEEKCYSFTLDFFRVVR